MKVNWFPNKKHRSPKAEEFVSVGQNWDLKIGVNVWKSFMDCDFEKSSKKIKVGHFEKAGELCICIRLCNEHDFCARAVRRQGPACYVGCWHPFMELGFARIKGGVRVEPVRDEAIPFMSGFYFVVPEKLKGK